MSVQWLNTKGGALLNTACVSMIYDRDGKVWAQLKEPDIDDDDEVQLAVENIMVLRMALKMRAVVIG